MRKILPSLLGVTDIKNFLERIQAMNKNKICNIDEFHVDMMDGKFVDNKCGKLEDIRTLNKFGMKSDVHFMYKDPENGIDKAVAYGANSITIHYEIPEFEKYLKKLKCIKEAYNINIGVSIRPKTDENEMKKYIDDIDIILVMSVEPGRGGQSFIEDVYDKIKRVRQMKEDICIVVDGGINDKNIAKVFGRGADKVVVGSYLTDNEDMLEEKVKLLGQDN